MVVVRYGECVFLVAVARSDVARMMIDHPPYHLSSVMILAKDSLEETRRLVSFVDDTLMTPLLLSKRELAFEELSENPNICMSYSHSGATVHTSRGNTKVYCLSLH
jgi:hypothetical protein